MADYEMPAANPSFKIILGSSSMSRRNILAEMGYEFTVMTADIDEKGIRKEKPEDLVMALAEAKVYSRKSNPPPVPLPSPVEDPPPSPQPKQSASTKQQCWQDAMNEELYALHENNTLELVALLKDASVVGIRWVYTTKLFSDGCLDRYKARLVAQGYNLEYDVDYEEAFSPVAKMMTIHTLLAVSSSWVDDMYGADAIISRLETSVQKENDAVPTLLITADQVVVHEGIIREKPSSKEEARQFITGYSKGQTSTVGSVLVTNLKTGTKRGACDRAEIYFHDIPNEVIESLIEEAVVLNVAGGLLVEHPLISPFVEAVVGTTDSVMGLPKALTQALIQEALYA